MQERGDPADQVHSDLALFLQALGNDGRVAVASRMSPLPESDALYLLEQFDAIARDEVALDLPAFDPCAALWSARIVHQLCRFVVCRDIPEEQIRSTCNTPCSAPRRPETEWSVDLTMCHLPALFRLARHLSNGDPLVEEIRRLGAEWPLSSVGIDGLNTIRAGACLDHPALLRLYADRVIAAADVSRLGDDRLDRRLQADLAMHHDLAPAISRKLFETLHDTR